MLSEQELRDELDILRKKLKENSESAVHISRIPPQTKKMFRALADGDFEGDYGMTLKWLIDSMTFNNRLELIDMRFQRVDERITAIEDMFKQKNNKDKDNDEIRLLNGNVLKR